MGSEKYKISVQVAYETYIEICDLEIVDFLAIIPVLAKMKFYRYDKGKKMQLIIEKDEPNAEINE